MITHEEKKRQQREWYYKNREYQIQKNREWKEKNRDKMLKQKKEYHLKNRDKILLKKKEYREKNQDKIKEYRQKHGMEYYNKVKNTKEFKEKRTKRRQRYYKENQDKIKTYYKNHMKNPKVKERKLEMSRLWNKNHPERRLQQGKKQLEKLGKPFNFSSLEYQSALISWTKSVRKRFGDICQVCYDKAHHSHHILHKAKYPELALNINNGIPLCKQHHREAHGQLLIQRGMN